MKLYRGQRAPNGEALVTVQEAGGSQRPLDPRLELRNHSPTGLEWGYGGSGPAQLALAILADCVGDELAQEHYQQFKWDLIAPLDREIPWVLREQDIRAWLARHGADVPETVPTSTGKR